MLAEYVFVGMRMLMFPQRFTKSAFR